jgi:uncharacterized protein with NRDE domain
VCLIVLALRHHPEYPLVVVANRDEYYARPSAPLDWWPEQTDMLAGKDMEAGGTWMGATPRGFWGAVTNYRERRESPAPQSRGELVAGFLSGDKEPSAYLDEVHPLAQRYGGFNLLVGTLDVVSPQLFCYSNRRGRREEVPTGVHTLSNHLLNTPWPKAELARLKLGHALLEQELTIEALLAVLADREQFEDHELPVTGVGIEMERVLSPPFIVAKDYGTRCTSVLMVDRWGNGTFAEQSFLSGGNRGRLALHEFRV